MQQPGPGGVEGLVHSLVLRLVDSLAGNALVPAGTALHQGSNQMASISLHGPSKTASQSASDAKLAEISVKRRALGEYALSILTSRMRPAMPNDPAEGLLWVQQRLKSKSKSYLLVAFAD